MSSQGIRAQLASIIERAPGAIRRRLRYRLHPRALRWKHLKKHHPTEPVITSLGRSLRVRVYPHDIIGQYIYVDGVFEPAEWRFAADYLREGMTFFDLGANLGQYTLLAASRVGRSGGVHSFEPCKRMFEELTFNVSLNGFSETCVLNNVAVSERGGWATLSTYPPGYEVYGSIGLTERPEGQRVGSEEVQTIGLDDYIAEKHVDHVDLVKIDIEGAELLALRGAKGLLSRPDAPTILIELADVNTRGFGYAAVEVWDWLAGLGYRLHGLRACGRRLDVIERPDDFSTAMNIVAMKTDKRTC